MRGIGWKPPTLHRRSILGAEVAEGVTNEGWGPLQTLRTPRLSHAHVPQATPTSAPQADRPARPAQGQLYAAAAAGGGEA